MAAVTDKMTPKQAKVLQDKLLVAAEVLAGLEAWQEAARAREIAMALQPGGRFEHRVDWKNKDDAPAD